MAEPVRRRHLARPRGRPAGRIPAALALLGGVLLAGLGCRSVGPPSIPRDRFSYSEAVADSWKSQMLLNLVKTRYLDLPIYLEVGQIVSGYTLETGVNLFGQVSPQSMRGDTFGGLGASGTYTDRPTITYTPLTGEKFLHGFLDPIHPVKVFSLIRSGYSAEFILRVCADSLNGLRNQPVGLASTREADADFFRAAALLGRLQDAGAVGVRVDPATQGEPALHLYFRTDHLLPASREALAELRGLLGLDEGRPNFRVVDSPLRGAEGELSLGTRSMMQVLGALARGVDIPPTHRERQLAPPIPDGGPGEPPLLRIASGPEAPEDAFVAVPYEDAWFWIAGTDWQSKRTFSSILFLFTLADAGGTDSLPVITIPAQ